MLEHIEVRNYQSLHHIELSLDRFTVIVGPSSSGKSAFTRALRMLTSNQRGDAFVTHGERTATVTARTEKGVVSLKRGGDNEYTVIPLNAPDQQRSFTKLAGAVPDEVTDFLGILPRDPLNYASQFDKPYLLDDSAAEVARVLGSLTNVTVILEAAREANRQRSAESSKLKTRQADLERTKTRIQQFVPLKNQLAALGRAEEELKAAATLQQQVTRLQNALDTWQSASEALTAAEEALAVTVPDIETITDAQAHLARYQQALEAMREHGTAYKSHLNTLDAIAAEEHELIEQYSQSLKQLAGGIRDHYALKSQTAGVLPGRGVPIIEVDEAAQLSADYIVEVLKP